MHKPVPTTQELQQQLRDQRETDFSRLTVPNDKDGRIYHYSPEEIHQHELDVAKATAQEIARREITTKYLADKKDLAAPKLAKIIPIAQAPSYHMRKIEQAQQEKVRATPQEW